MQSPIGDATCEVKNFEELLKKYNAEKSPALYSNVIQNNTNIQPKDVLDSVYSQIRTIQLADMRDFKVKANSIKKSTFLPIYRLPVYQEAPKPNNFETQCFSNTQLINIMDDAEALHQGMTEEFESTFLPPSVDNNSKIIATNTTDVNQLNLDTQEFDTTFTQTNIDTTILFLNDVIETDENNYEQSNKKLTDLELGIREVKIKQMEDNDINQMLLKPDVIKPVETLKESFDQALDSKLFQFTGNEAINKTSVNSEGENIEKYKDDGNEIKMNDYLGACEHRSSSPVFKTKTKKMKTMKNLVVSLENFEKFENIALHFIDIDKDLETCKHLISSQILEGELCLNAENCDKFHDNDQFSPVLEKSCQIVLHNKAKIKEEKEKAKSTNINYDKDSKDKRSDSLKDEILFSSDEENEFIYKKFDDMPLTAVLETSFYNYSDVLDKTMFVGFQTANDKSIRISTDSFYKAQSILEDNDYGNFSMKDLVDVYNEKSLVKINSQNEEDIFKLVENSSDNYAKESCPHKDGETIENVINLDPVVRTVKKSPEKTNFHGSSTASDKKMKIPDKALELGKIFFMDVDLDNKNHKLSNEDLVTLNKGTKDAREIKNDIDDKILIQEFENIEMSLEEIDTTANFHQKAASSRNINKCSEGKDIYKELTDVNEKLKTDGNKEINTTNKTNSIGFKTANNKNINVSAEAMAKTKAIFEDIDTALIEIKNDNLSDDQNINIDCDQCSTSFIGLETAKNRTIKLCDAISKSSETSENIMKEFKSKPNPIELHSESINNEVIEKVLQWRKTFEYKNTAHVNDHANRNKEKSSKNNMILPKKSSARMKKLFENLDMKCPHIVEPCNDSKNQNNTFKGFQTASKKPVNISVKALQRSKKIFQEVDSYNTANPFDENLATKMNIKSASKEIVRKQDSIKLEGCKTATNKKVDVTKEAIARSKRILDFDILPENDKTMSKTGENHIGFHTFSNKKFKVSEENLEITKKILNDIELCEVNEDKLENYDIASKKIESLFNKTETQETKELGFRGFETKNKKISKDAIEKTKTILSGTKVPDIAKRGFSEEAIEKTRPSSGDIALLESNDIGTFKGFQTASNNQVKISKEALEKTKAVFDDIEITDIQQQGLKGFQTASHKNFKISEEAKKTKAIFGDIEIPEIENHGFRGFQTANNKKIEISKEAVEKTKTLFKDIDILEVKDQGFRGFQTASNKSIKISEESMKNNNALFCDIEFPETEKHGFGGFQTANNKKVEISKEAIEKTKTLFKDIDISEVNEQGFRGFQTASNKSVKISEESIKKTKALFNDIEIPGIEKHGFGGFQTANNKIVEISKEAIEKTKMLFKDIDISEVNEQGFRGFQTASNKNVKISEESMKNNKTLFFDTEFPESEKHEFGGFQTANNKKVEISKEAIEKTKTLYRDIDTPEAKEQGFRGFQTASNRNVKISEEAMKMSKALFDDIEIPDNKDVGAFMGFQTGNKKKVTISELALAKSRQFLQDACKIENDINKEVKSNEFSLKLANNKNTHVPRNTLIDSKEMLNDSKNNLGATINKAKDVKLYNIDNLITTQVLDYFEKSLCTEDFNETPKRNKRSGSPILSCPRTNKRKKFEAPYKEESKRPIKLIQAIDKPKAATKVIFTEGYKKNKVNTIKDLPNIDNKKVIDPYILQFNLDNILNFVFETDRNDLTDTKMNISDVKEIFLSAVNKNLVPEGWLDNHIKLILWKLLSYEIKFDFKCTVQSVLDQLKTRYDKELYNAERSAFRKILEKDDVATKTMFLCIAGVYVDGASVSSATRTDNIELLLTDGWYFIKATIDRMLSKLVMDSRIVVGSKIVTSGAELTNCEQGMAPWEDTSAVRLKLSGNSTRPAPWYSKLGYTRAAILSHLSSVKVDGGRISRLRVFVTRVYPLLYVERLGDGSTVTRSERLEHLHQMKYEAERELMMERIYEEVQREYSDQESQDSEVQVSGKRSCYDSGSQIAKMMKRSRDPMEFRAQLTSSQVHLLQEHTSRTRQKIVDTIQQRIQDRLSTRNVVTLARGRIVENERGSVSKGMLSIWKPNEAVLDLFREGASIEIMNAVPTALRYSELQITAGRQTMFRQTKIKDNPPILQSFKRKCYTISELADNPSMNTEYNEIDTAGIVFLIEPTQEQLKSNNNFQNVYLADDDKNIIGINFWGGVKKFGFENILDTGQIVACANLQKRAGNTRKNIPQYRVTEFSSFTKTPRNIQARDIVDELTKKMHGLDRRKFCDDCIAIKNNYTAIRCLNNNENESPYRFNKSEYSFNRNKMFIDTPKDVKPYRNEDVNINLTGLDFESTFRQDTQDLSPNTLQRKKKVNERIARLKMYGEPPPLSPINIINKSINAKNSYKSPLISDNAIKNPQNSVAIVNNSPVESPKAIPKSPVISMKRTYMKSESCVPVKLNFEENKSESVDHFADDFDASPPLSLD